MRINEIRVIASIIEDELIENFDYEKHISTASLSVFGHNIEVVYDTLLGTLDISDMQDVLSGIIDTDKILNEIRLEKADLQNCYNYDTI